MHFKIIIFVTQKGAPLRTCTALRSFVIQEPTQITIPVNKVKLGHIFQQTKPLEFEKG